MELKDFPFLCYYCKNAAVRKKIFFFFSSVYAIPTGLLSFFCCKAEKKFRKKNGTGSLSILKKRSVTK